MAQRKPRRRSGAKIATKKEQAELLQRAKALAEDPSPLVPDATATMKRVAQRLERRLHKVAKAKENQRKLKGFMKRGPELTRAYANLLMVATTEQAGRMASTETPVGSLKYAVRGMVPRQASVAVQHYRYPQVRVLAYRDVVRKTRAIIWATRDKVMLSGRKEPPPREWLDIVTEHVNVELTKGEEDGQGLQCAHLVQESRDRSPLAFELEIDAGPTRFQVCKECVETGLKSRDKGLLVTVAALVVGLKPRHFDARVIGTPKVCLHDGECSWQRQVPKIADQSMLAYREGRRSEQEVLSKLLPRWEERVREAPERVLVAGDECYGDDKERFLEATQETGERREVLERFLALGPSAVIAKDATMNQVLEACWEAAPRVLAELHPYKDELDGLLKKHARSPPAAVVDEVLEARRAHEVLKGYPRYDTLPSAARVADRLARAYKTGGDSAMVAIVEKELDQRTHKGLLWAALRLGEQEEAHRWRFDKTAIESGEFLEAPLEELTGSQAGDYHEKLSRIHTLAGGEGTLPEPVGQV